MSCRRQRAFTLVELITAIGLVTLLSLAVIPFIARFPRAVAAIEERQAAAMLLDAQVERARYLVLTGRAGPGETALLTGAPQAGGIAAATSSMTVTVCEDKALPPGLWRVVVHVAWQGRAVHDRRLERSFLIRASGGDGDG